MNLFVDASAMVAMIVKEADHRALEAKFGAATATLCSAISLWETVRALSKIRGVAITEASDEADRFVRDFDIQMVTIGDAERGGAIEAYARYGKGHHPARLNMGDCFAYACAKTNDARLLYKGDDFSKTDLA